MSRIACLAVIGLTALAVPAAAEEVTVAQPLAAASLHEGPLDLVAYFLETGTDAIEVTATFAPRTARAEPVRVVMALEDGDATTFSVPGFRGSNYSFARAGDALIVSVAPLTRMASIE